MKKFIDRNILKPIHNHLDKKEITLITGPRRAGKTTIIEVLMKDVKDSGYFNLDRERDFEFFESQERVISYIKGKAKKTNKLYIFIDEIQRKENAGLFLKGIYDYTSHKKLDVKFVVTGSGSLELKEKISESLAGRKKVFNMDTLSFEEFFRYKSEFSDSMGKYWDIYPKKLFEYFVEYINYGGYPDVVLASKDEKASVLEEIYDSYVEKDVKGLLNIKNSSSFSDLVKILASQVGGLVNREEIANTLNLNSKTVSTYIDYLEKTYIIKIPERK